LRFKNPEHAVVEVSDKITSLGLKNREVNNMSESIPNQRIKEHSKINMQVPFRTDIPGEIKTETGGAIYSKQYPYNLHLKICETIYTALTT